MKNDIIVGPGLSSGHIRYFLIMVRAQVLQYPLSGLTVVVISIGQSQGIDVAVGGRGVADTKLVSVGPGI